MAGTATVVNHPCYAYYTFTSASSPADEVITVGFTPTLVLAMIDVDATTGPEMAVGYNASTLAKGIHFKETANTSGVLTSSMASVALASGVSFSGATCTIESAIQNASGENVVLIWGS